MSAPAPTDQHKGHAGVVTRLERVVIIALFLVPVAAASAQTTEWTEQFGTAKLDFLNGLAVARSAAYVAGGTAGALSGERSHGEWDAYVRAYDLRGRELWTHQFGTSDYDWAGDVAVDRTGVYVSGVTNGALRGQESSGRRDSFIRKYRFTGQLVWTRQFGTPRSDYGGDLAAGPTGVYTAGNTLGAFPHQRNHGGYDAFIRKYDAHGDAKWTRQFGTPRFEGGSGTIAVDASGEYLALATAGSLEGSNLGETDAVVRKYDPRGNAVWTRQFGTPERDGAFAIAAGRSGIYVAGYTRGTLPGQASLGGDDAFVQRLDADGKTRWVHQFGSTGDDVAWGIALGPTGVVVVGWAGASLSGMSVGGFDAFVRTYGRRSRERWTTQFGTPRDDHAEVAAFGPSALFVAGGTHGALLGHASRGRADVFLSKIV
jgi:hypothetical protein